MTQTVRQGLIWLLHTENGMSTAEIAAMTAKSRRTVQASLKAARDFLDRSSNLDWLELVMRGVDKSNCTHPVTKVTGKVTVCLWCDWTSHPNDRRLFTVKPKPFKEADQIAAEVQPDGPAKFQPNVPAKSVKKS